MNELFEKRIFLINDYISQILVYGSNTNGNINLNKQDDSLMLSVSVIKNAYFRFHNLGIDIKDVYSFYKELFNSILDKFKEFDIRFGSNNIIVSSKVNNNQIDISFTLFSKKDENLFEKVKKDFYTRSR